jgi:hypothetical protein
VFNNPTFFIDLLAAIWIMVLVSGIFIGLPSLLLGSSSQGDRQAFLQENRKNVCLLDRLANGFSRMLALMCLGTLLWARLGLLTWLTTALTVIASLFTIWVFGSARHPQRKLQQVGQNFLAIAVDLLDRGISLRSIVRFIGNIIYKLRTSIKIKDSMTAVTVIILLIILLLSWYVRFQHPLSELRFTSADSYSQLLLTQQILSRDTAIFDAAAINGRVPVLAALTAAISLLSSINPIHAQHFTLAIVGCWLTVALGYTLWKLTDNLAASVVGMTGLGIYLFTWSGAIAPDRSERVQVWLGNIVASLNYGLVRQWNPGEFELGAIFLLLGLAATTQISQRHQRFDGLLSGICCMLILLMTAPALLLLLLVGGIGLIIGRPVALLAITMVWFGAALLAALPDRQLPIDQIFLRTLPIDLSLILGILFLLIVNFLQSLIGAWTNVTILVLVLGLALNFGWPNDLAIERLEYEAAARKTLEISRRFPYKNWTMVAPNEQLSQSFQQGWYEDLAKFVQKYQEPVEAPTFQLPFTTANIFVMVEKKPFSNDQEYADVPYSTLADPVYANYRSSIGRSKLEANALALCETYAKNHRNSKVYYEDAVIKIYQFSGIPPKLTNLNNGGVYQNHT